jgi:hypothetical protein
MAALKDCSGTVPCGYAKLRGEQQGDLADTTASDSAVCTGCNAQLHVALLFCSYSKIQIKLISGGNAVSYTKFHPLVRHNINYGSNCFLT